MGFQGAFQEASDDFWRISETLQKRYIGVFEGFQGFQVRYVESEGFLGVFRRYSSLLQMMFGLFQRRYRDVT